ncbi:bifunctional aminoglycoside phosphotransferase/ATP-binding protein [Marimonas arenosa]|uniref:AAA family ATPase n=1 Tax=Marimonas arenosa TaxID=1795305 RepID=A0AAE3WCG7_9RHOB|nr:bifunctional aminoglycoside phosphotransferase/ATP-binding protein [Marimonas arenosa]MDQ2089948.1 AAA family ATPase [Marimonas arenosa]
MADNQTETIAFLSSPDSFGAPDPVDRVETHGAFVFLCGDTALKLKRAVIYDYMDLSTPDKRRAMLMRELELNRPAAPTLYRDVVAVTREADGRLALDGAGDPVDWVLRMRRFPAEDELEAVAARGGLDDVLATELGHSLAAYHHAAPVRLRDGTRLIADILDELDRVFAGFPGTEALRLHRGWSAGARNALDRHADLLKARGQTGAVRRGHGDLHLRNLVLLDGRPVPFDALEFDETLGTCDLLYDLAFLLMDLCHRDLRRAAARVLDAWLLDFQGRQDAGLAALPLFLSVRAAIRAMVLLQTDAARGMPHASDAEVALLLQEATGFLRPPPPVCIAVGGFSGTGKSLLARGLAPHVGAAPGAVWLASDVLRKAGRDNTAPLPDAAYSATARGQVYERMMARAGTILGAGHTVILDATFLDPTRRTAARDMATALDVPFVGLWLTAPPDRLRQRVAGRRGDASDADVAVLERQLAAGSGTVDWRHLDATCDAGATLSAARAALADATPAGA